MDAFRVRHYRPILDSGWIEVGDIAVIVGKNESGKTSLLKALWKFNPFKAEPFDISREWPRGHRKDRDEAAPVVTVRFAFTEEERAHLAALDPATRGLTGVEVSRNYRGEYAYDFLPRQTEERPDLADLFHIVQDQMKRLPASASFDEVKAGAMHVLESYTQPAKAYAGGRFTVQAAEARATAVNAGPRMLRPPAGALQITCHNPDAEVFVKPPIRRAVEAVHGWLPTFVYMDDYKIFTGSAHLDQVKQRRDADRLTEEDRTVLTIMEMAGLNLDDEVRKAGAQDKEERMLDMNDASQTLTEEIAHRWSQKRYEVMFQADGHHFITFVKDVDTSILVPLEERSKGFQWFFSFDMTFMHETRGEFSNAVILLDEPGLHLHAAAQRDLLGRMAAYAEHNQLIYSTHLPYMIDVERLEHTYVAEEDGKSGTRARRYWDSTDRDARFTLQAAFGLKWRQSLFGHPYTLIVGDVADFWLLTSLSTLLKAEGHPGLDDDLTVTPAGGAADLAFITPLLYREPARIAVLLTAERQQDVAPAPVARQWLEDTGHLIAIDRVLGVEYPCTLEDLFPMDYYLGYLNAEYRSELGGSFPSFSDSAHSLTSRAAAALSARDIPFDRARVARAITQDLASKPLNSFPPATVTHITTLCDAINAIVKRWKQEEK